jgi:predicted ribosomally synthesized peptide with SipW-like signal peptide
MSKHRATRPARRTSLRSKVLGVVALLAALLVGIGGRSTFAYWNDTSTVTSGAFSSGKLDLAVNGDAATTTTVGSLALATMVPGESVAATVLVGNVGDVAFTWSVAAGTSTGPLAGALSVALYPGGTASNSTSANGLRSGACSGTAGTTGPGVLAAKTGSTTPTANLCVLVTFSSNADNTLQSQTTASTVGFKVTATQVTS